MCTRLALRHLPCFCAPLCLECTRLAVMHLSCFCTPVVPLYACLTFVRLSCFRAPVWVECKVSARHASTQWTTRFGQATCTTQHLSNQQLATGMLKPANHILSPALSHLGCIIYQVMDCIAHGMPAENMSPHLCTWCAARSCNSV